MPLGGRVVLGGTAGAGEVGPPFSELFDRGPEVPPVGPDAFAGWLTCSRFLRVTSSVLRLRKRCCRCTASFDEEASSRTKQEASLRYDNTNIVN